MTIDYAAILAWKLKTLFPDDASLSEALRVQLAVLRIAGGNVAELRRHLAIAKRDYRCTLATAEYPAQMRGPLSPTPEERRRLIAASAYRSVDM